MMCPTSAPKPRSDPTIRWLESLPHEGEVWLTQSQARCLKAKGEHAFTSSSKDDHIHRGRVAVAHKTAQRTPITPLALVEEEAMADDSYTAILNDPYPHDVIDEMR